MFLEISQLFANSWTLDKWNPSGLGTAMMFILIFTHVYICCLPVGRMCLINYMLYIEKNTAFTQSNEASYCFKTYSFTKSKHYIVYNTNFTMWFICISSPYKLVLILSFGNCNFHKSSHPPALRCSDQHVTGIFFLKSVQSNNISLEI